MLIKNNTQRSEKFRSFRQIDVLILTIFIEIKLFFKFAEAKFTIFLLFHLFHLKSGITYFGLNFQI